MKVFVFLSFLIVAVAGQGLGSGLIDELCDELPGPDCRSKAGNCIMIRRSSEKADSNIVQIRACSEENGVNWATLKAAILAASNLEGGELLDNLPVDATVVRAIRNCVLVKVGLADADGNPDHEAIKARLSAAYNKNLASHDKLLGAMLGALDTCPLPVEFARPQEFRHCIAVTCMQNV